MYIDETWVSTQYTDKYIWGNSDCTRRARPNWPSGGQGGGGGQGGRCVLILNCPKCVTVLFTNYVLNMDDKTSNRSY